MKPHFREKMLKLLELERNKNRLEGVKKFAPAVGVIHNQDRSGYGY